MRAMSAQAHQDPKLAKELAYGYGHTPMGIGIDASSLPLRYSATGEVCTPEKDALYAKQTGELKDASSALYAREKANGTPDADILDQLLTLAASQPPDFRALFGWGPEE